MNLPSVVYLRRNSVSSSPYTAGDDIAVIHLDEKVSWPARTFKGNDETGADWRITLLEDGRLPEWVHTHHPAKVDSACTSCARPDVAARSVTRYIRKLFTYQRRYS